MARFAAVKRVSALIGELLLQHGWVEAASVERALAEQPHTGMRLCSLLVTRGLLDADLAARALGLQFGVPAALQRHLHHRDTTLARRLPAELGRTCCALPIGASRSGELVVCVRDPRPELLIALNQATGADVVMTVATAKLLEAIVHDVYGPANEFDVDMSTNPHDVIDPRMVAATKRAETEPGMNLKNMTLVGLDDDRVAKDPSQSGSFKPPGGTMPPPIPGKPPTTPPPVSAKPPTTPPPVSARPPPIPNRPSEPPASPPRTYTRPDSELGAPGAPQASYGPPDMGPQLPSRTATATAPPRTAAASRPPPIVFLDDPEPVREAYVPPVRATSSLELDPVVMTIDEVAAALELAVTNDEATELAMSFAAERWIATLLLVIQEGAARGHRGHGPNLTMDAIRAVTVPLTSESIVREAYDLRRFVTEMPSGVGAIQDRLLRMLDLPSTPCAIPIIVGGNVAYVIVVGDPVDEDAGAELVRLGAALASAYQRIARETRREI